MLKESGFPIPTNASARRRVSLPTRVASRGWCRDHGGGLKRLPRSAQTELRRSWTGTYSRRGRPRQMPSLRTARTSPSWPLRASNWRCWSSERTTAPGLLRRTSWPVSNKPTRPSTSIVVTAPAQRIASPGANRVAAAITAGAAQRATSAPRSARNAASRRRRSSSAERALRLTQTWTGRPLSVAE